MSEETKTTITSLFEILQSHTYNVNTGWDKCSFNLSAQTLLDIATYAQANRAKLEQEAQENIENLRTQLEDTTEMHPVNPEWRYKTSNLQLSPLPPESVGLVTRATDEDVEYSQCAQSLLDRRGDTGEINPEWRYKTSDLRL